MFTEVGRYLFPAYVYRRDRPFKQPIVPYINEARYSVFTVNELHINF